MDNIYYDDFRFWFAANVVQVIGILLIIARHLFPQEHTRKSDNGEK
jgi:hypothetical protein